jgi:hypothetical protein
MQSPAP